MAHGNGRDDHPDQLNDLYYIFVDQNQSLYVSDNKNDRVMMWTTGAEGIIVAGGQAEENQKMTLHSCRILLKLPSINRVLCMYEMLKMFEKYFGIKMIHKEKSL